jgi:hypothetical protein
MDSLNSINFKKKVSHHSPNNLLTKNRLRFNDSEAIMIKMTKNQVSRFSLEDKTR